jgi:hypothetical protein
VLPEENPGALPALSMIHFVIADFGEFFWFGDGEIP